MDMRVWHGGTENNSKTARPMLSVHYSGPSYSEDVLKDGGSIPFFGTCYWTYHRGALQPESFECLSESGKSLCKNLVSSLKVSCSKCHMSHLSAGRSALRSIGPPSGPWLCLNCWAAQKSSIMRWAWDQRCVFMKLPRKLQREKWEVCLKPRHSNILRRDVIESPNPAEDNGSWPQCQLPCLLARHHGGLAMD